MKSLVFLFLLICFGCTKTQEYRLFREESLRKDGTIDSALYIKDGDSNFYIKRLSGDFYRTAWATNYTFR